MEEASPWKTFLVRGVPKSYTDLSGTHPTDDLIPEEARIRAGASRPVKSCKKAPFGETLETAGYFISFGEEVKPGFRLFGSSLTAELQRQKPRITQCTRCLGFHNPRSCTRVKRCLNCGKPEEEHKEDLTMCSSPQQCANCNGAHTADNVKCLARPAIKEGELKRATKEQLKKIRELGQREFNKSNPLTPAVTTNQPRLNRPSSPSTPSRLVIEVDLEEEDAPMANSPARSEIHVALPPGEEPTETEDIDMNPGGKSGPYQDVALSLAWEGGYDIVLIQEPYAEWDQNSNRRQTKNHPGFQTYNPLNDWRAARPSVLTFVRISPDLPCKQLSPPGLENGCVCWIEVCNYTIVNIYRRASEDTTTETLTKWGTPPPQSIIAGDFNATHWTWQPGRRPDAAGNAIAEWAEEHNLLPSLVDSSTRDSGKCIDLVFSNCSISSRADHSLATGSDHYTVVISLPDPVRPTPGAGKKYLPLDKYEGFGQLMHTFARTLPLVNLESPSKGNLDSCTEALQKLFQDVLEAAGKTRH
ncbi:Endonuclease/exonuclease/phosphatase [Trichoderma austrokoningii]